MIQRWVVTLLVLASSTYAFATPIYSDPIFAGKYRCIGTDPYINKTYSGTVTVTQQNSVYRLEMDYDTGERSIGTGGQYDKTLMSVVFQDRKNLKNIGLEQYTFTPDKKVMQGYWVYLGEDKLGKERCEKLEEAKKSST